VTPRTRYLTRLHVEPLRDSLARRVKLLWGCITFNPDPDFHELMREFRHTVTEWVPVEPGDPEYDDAPYQSGIAFFGPDMRDRIYDKLIEGSPWCNLIPKDQS
jgi:hypothetical protein